MIGPVHLEGDDIVIKVICNISTFLHCPNVNLLPTGSEEKEVLEVGSIPVALLPSCQDMKTIAF